MASAPVQIAAKWKAWDVPAIHAAIAECGGVPGAEVFDHPAMRIHMVEVPEGADPDTIVAALRAHLLVARASILQIPEVIRRAPVASHVASNDARLDDSWQHKRMNVFAAWRLLGHRGSKSIKVGVIDSGIAGNPDLPLPDFWGSTGIADTDYQRSTPFYSHGTNCWSCIMESAGNGIGGAGVAPGSYGAFASDLDGGGSMVGGVVVGGLIVEMADAGVRILSLSWGWSCYPEDPNTTTVSPWADLRDACDYFMAAGGLIFVASGNGATDYYPATNRISIPNTRWVPNEYDGIINVGGLGSFVSNAYDDPKLSAYGPGIDIVAPASDVFMADCQQRPLDAPGYGWGGGYTSPNPTHHNSTSFATPLTAGVAALVWAANPSLLAADVRSILIGTATPGRHANYATRYPTANIVNAAHGVAKALSTVAANAGNIYPVCTFSGAGTVTSVASGTATTALDGQVYLEAGAYSSDPILYVEVRHGPRCVYRGPPASISTTATAGTGDLLTVKAFTANGSAEETYTDINVAALALATVPDVTYPTDTTWEVLVPVSEAPGTFEAVASTGETASVTVTPDWGLPLTDSASNTVTPIRHTATGKILAIRRSA